MNKTRPFPLPINGVDLLSDETSLIKGTVRAAVDVDIGRAGRVQRRVGYTEVAASTGLHSLYYAPQKGWTLIAENNVLCRLDTTTYARTPLHTMNTDLAIDYVEYNGNIYATNRYSICWVPSDSSAAFPVGVVVPDAPTLSIANGGLLPGKYGVVITMADARGEESGASDVRFLDLPDGGGIRMSNLPQAAGSSVYVYVTSADGDVLRFAAALPAAFPIYVVAETAQGAICGTQFMKPMPPGDFVRWHNGRLFTAKDGSVYFSEPLRPHLHNPAHGVIPFSGHVAFIEPVLDGIFIGDSRGVWFLDGADPAKMSSKLVSPYRAISRSSISMSPDNFDPETVNAPSAVAVWLSTVGYMAGVPGGGVVELNSTRIRVPFGVAGRTSFMIRNGRKQVVSLVNSLPTTANGTAVDSSI